LKHRAERASLMKAAPLHVTGAVKHWVIRNQVIFAVVVNCALQHTDAVEWILCAHTIMLTMTLQL
jgi:hypothetical protein